MLLFLVPYRKNCDFDRGVLPSVLESFQTCKFTSSTTLFSLLMCFTMNPVFKKMNFKNQSEIYVIKSPDSFRAEISEMTSLTDIIETLPSAQNSTKIDFCLIFVKLSTDIENFALALAPHISADVILWFAYPKKSSKKIISDIDRDTGWISVGNILNMEPVKIIAIDKDWSALRFRKVDQIKTMTRNTAMILTKDGLKKTSGK